MNVEKIKDAYAVLAGIPAARFVPYLGSFYSHRDGDWTYPDPKNTKEVSCGTLACGAGWLAVHPAFRSRRRVGFDYGDISERLGIVLDVSDIEFWRLFDIRGHSSFDSEGTVIRKLSDKALLLYRIRRFLGQGKLEAFIAASEDAR
jgi:hypothetical protein